MFGIRVSFLFVIFVVFKDISRLIVLIGISVGFAVRVGILLDSVVMFGVVKFEL